MAKFDDLNYSLTWRPNYELYQVLVMLAGCLFYALYGFWDPTVRMPAVMIGSIFMMLPL